MDGPGSFEFIDIQAVNNGMEKNENIYVYVWSIWINLNNSTDK